MLRSWFHQALGARGPRDRSPHAAHRRRKSHGFEVLEGRQLLSHLYTVNSLNDAGVGSLTSGDLRYCITKADSDPNSTIQFSVNGTIDVTSPLPGLTANTTVKGPGALNLTVDYTGKQPASVFSVASGATATVSGLTVTGGTGTKVVFQNYGGDIANAGTLTLDQCTITGGQAYGGGGIANAGTLTLKRSTVSGNQAVAGGGIENFGTMTLNASTISGNQANLATTTPSLQNGGGIENFGKLTVSGCTVSGNHALNNGGGIDNAGTLTVLTTTVSDNVADANGGGVNNGFFHSATILSSTLSGNQATTGGGVASTGVLTVFDSTFAGNAAAVSGGGAFVGGIGTMINDTVADNLIFTDSTSPEGAGVQVANFGFVTLHNSIVAENFLARSDLSFTEDDVAGTVSSWSSCNLIGDGTGLSGINNKVNGNLIGTSTSPIDPMLGPLADNGGPTQTLALLAGSRAIDAGNNFDIFPVLYFVTDQRGQPRVVDGGIGYPRVDIGAYEYVPLPS